MKSVLLLVTILTSVSASIFLPTTSVRSLAASGSSSNDVAFHRRRSANRVLKQRVINTDGKPLAMAIPGNSVAEQVVIGGEWCCFYLLNFPHTSNCVYEFTLFSHFANVKSWSRCFLGFGNFIAIYNSVITARILLSWFPQAQSVGFLQPVYQITDPYLNLFRGIIPPIFGLDFSPILAFVTLNLLQTSAVSLAAEVPKDMREKLEKESWGVVGKKPFGL